MTHEQKIVEIVKETAGKEIDAILLYGSHVSGKTTPRSDIDICVVFKEPLSVREATIFRKKIHGELPSKFDVQVFSTLPLKVKKRIADHHKLLYSSKEFDDISFTLSSRKKFFELEHRKAGIKA